MDVKNKVEVVYKNEEFECRFLCEPSASLGFLYDASCQFRAFIMDKMKEFEEGQKKEEEKEEVVEEKPAE